MNEFPEFKDYLRDYLSSVKDRYTRDNFAEAGLEPTQKLIVASIDQHIQIARKNYMEDLEERVKYEAMSAMRREARNKHDHCKRVVLACVAWEICNAYFLIVHNNDPGTIWMTFHLIVAVSVGVAFMFMVKPFSVMIAMEIASAREHKDEVNPTIE